MAEPLLEFRSLTKQFCGTPVLKNVSFSLQAGTVLGLVGENGAGKSTLMNILGGNLVADSGTMGLGGTPYLPTSPQQAVQAGVMLVHQELNLFANLSIAENLFLTEFPGRSWGGCRWIDRRTLQQQAEVLLTRVGLSVSSSTPIGALTPGQRQLVEIAKALRGNPRIIVCDEPTTSLGKPETERLFSIIARLREEGVAVIYISHNLGDVLRLCDQVVVLRDGEVQATGPRGDFSSESMIALMVGRNLHTLYPRRTGRPQSETVLKVEGVSQPGIVENISFTLQRGELLGIAGLMGSGRTELVRILFGLDPCQRGRIVVKDVPLRRPAPRHCIRRGMALLTENRRDEGLLMEASVEENMTLTSLPRFAVTPFGWIRRRQMRRHSEDLAKTLNIECRSLTRQPVKTLSGGNQQKVVLARWFLSGAELFLLDEPTRGVDVGAKQEIYQQINRLVDAGASIVWISSELEELTGLCDRILVMSSGEIQAVVPREEFDRHEILKTAFGKERLQ